KSHGTRMRRKRFIEFPPVLSKAAGTVPSSHFRTPPGKRAPVPPCRNQPAFPFAPEGTMVAFRRGAIAPVPTQAATHARTALTPRQFPLALVARGAKVSRGILRAREGACDSSARPAR